MDCGADARVAVVEQRFKHGVADADILSDIRLKALERLFAHAGIPVVAQGHHERVADAGGLATVAGAALGGQQADGVVAHAGGGGVLVASMSNWRMAGSSSEP